MSTCTTLLQIQTDHALECPSIQLCNFSTRSAERLEGASAFLLDVFSDADFVIPYILNEEESGQ